ncbi:MAG: hypothetical protein JNN08_16195 [Bryobacterales bacterium]|nr:hypothetical protein [Bryobacterales bacterium]
MHENENPSLEQIRAFLESSQEVQFQAEGRADIYAWVGRALKQQDYAKLSRAAKGLVRGYVKKMTGLSLAQVTRLIGQYAKTQLVTPTVYRRHRFRRRYTLADVALLVAVDQAHGRLNGPATRAILTREYKVFGNPEYERLARISVGQLYNLRNSAGYRRQRIEYTATRPTPVSIGERRRPDP